MPRTTAKIALAAAALLAAIGAIGASRASAQDHFQGGFLVGATAAQVDGDAYDGYNKPGLCAGAWVSRPLGGAWSAALQIRYAGKGSKNALGADQQQPEYYRLSLHYVEVPLEARYHFKRYYAHAGAAVAVLAGGRHEGFFGGYQGANNATGFNRFDFLALGGLGMRIGDLWTAEATLSYSVVDAARRYRSVPKPYLYKQHNNVVSVSFYRTVGRP